jgi:tetratricopeptide (TPR) repeat protein
MKQFVRIAIVSLLSVILVVGSDSGDAAEPTAFSLPPEFSLDAARATSAEAYQNEKEGKYADALKGYRNVIRFASTSMKESDARGTVRTPQMYLILGAAYLDVARMERELIDFSSASASRQSQADIEADLAMAEKALKESLRLIDHSPTLDLYAFLRRWLVEQTLGDLYLYKADLTASRQHYQLALNQNPRAEHAARALAFIDLAEKRKSAEELENRGWKIPVAIKKFASSKASRETTAEIVKCLIGRSSPLAGSIAGQALDALMKSAAGVKD